MSTTPQSPTATLDKATLPPSLHEAYDLIDHGVVSTVFTDVFDTVLWRRVTEPENLFATIGERLAAGGNLHPSLTPRGFGHLRRRAETEARGRLAQDTQSPEVNLWEIWDRIPEWVHRGKSRDQALAVELALEREITVPDLDIAALLTFATQRGMPVAAVSDTYLSGDQLRQLLERPGLDAVVWRAVVTSSDHRVNKAGTLFDRALERLEVAPGQVLHLGDNPGADIGPARERGINAVYFERRDPQLAKIVLDEARFAEARPAGSPDAARASEIDEGALVQLRAKMAHRTELFQVPSALQPFWRYGAQILGPAFAGYAEWAAEIAASYGTGHVFCLMREGAFLEDLIGNAARVQGLELQTHRLHINRQLSTLAAIGDGGRDDLLMLTERRSAATVASLLTMIGVDPARVPSLRPHLGFPSSDATARDAFIAAILGDPALQAGVAARADALRRRVLRSIDEVSPDGPIVICDLGWGASIQRRLITLLRQGGTPRPVVGLYLLTHEGASTTVAAGGEVYGYLGNMGTPERATRSIMRSPEILEQVCMPDHGTQIDLTEDLEPIYEATRMPAGQAVQAESVRRGILAFQREYVRYSLLDGEQTTLRGHGEALAAQIARSVAAPTEDEAVRFGAWLHDEGQGSTLVEPLIDDHSRAAIGYLSPEELVRVPMERLYWPFGVARAVDAGLATGALMAEAGEVPEGLLSSRLETGTFAIEPAGGVGVEPSAAYRAVPRRNVHGRSYASATLRGRHVSRLQIRFGERPAIIRFDRIAVQLHLRDAAEPIVVRLDEAARAGQLEVVGATPLGDGVFAAHHGEALVAWSCGHVTQQEVHTIEVETLFAALPWSPPPASDPRSPARMQQAEAVRVRMEQSLSWRSTKALRSVKRLKG